jgi:hypothetical protein
MEMPKSKRLKFRAPTMVSALKRTVLLPAFIHPAGESILPAHRGIPWTNRNILGIVSRATRKAKKCEAEQKEKTKTWVSDESFHDAACA